jgi:hypothetical protein
VAILSRTGYEFHDAYDFAARSSLSSADTINTTDAKKYCQMTPV